MNETFDSAAEKFSPGNHPGDRHQNEVASAMSTWIEILKNNLFVALLGTVVISFLAGYFISQQQEARKRDQWAEIFSAKPNTGSLIAAGKPPTQWSRAWSTRVRLLNKPPVRE